MLINSLKFTQYGKWNLATIPLDCREKNSVSIFFQYVKFGDEVVNEKKVSIKRIVECVVFIIDCEQLFKPFQPSVGFHLETSHFANDWFLYELQRWVEMG